MTIDKTSPSQDITVNRTEVHHHIVLSIEDSFAAFITAWNRAGSHVLCFYVANKSCFAGEWARSTAVCPFAEQWNRLGSCINELRVRIVIKSIRFHIERELTLLLSPVDNEWQPSSIERVQSHHW